MHQELKKKYKEVIAQYLLEKDLDDVFVEGFADKAFFDNFLKTKKTKKKVVPIETINFTDITDVEVNNLDIKSNRNKVIILSRLIDSSIPSSKVKFIIDKDFDDYLPVQGNKKLLKTDFSCLESYLFSEVVIEKFLSIGLTQFPISTEIILTELSKVLKSLFCLRLLKELYYKSSQQVEYDNNLNIDNKKGTINFNETEYLEKFINKNKLASKKELIHKQFSKLMANLNLEIRHHIHGHDFLEIFFLYINKIKNTQKYKNEHFGKVLFLTVDVTMIEDFPLFKSLIS